MDRSESVLHALIGGVIGLGCLAVLALGQPRETAGSGAKRLAVRDDGRRVTVRLDGTVVMRYRHSGDLFKPYVAELRLPDGRNVLRDSPPDHRHHHGLMFAWNVDGVEFWGETGRVGRQVHRRFTETKPARNGEHACIAEEIDWVGPDGKTVLLRERRKITVFADAGPADRLIAWEGEFAAPDPKRDVTITGRKYFGLGVRFPVPMDRRCRFMTAEGETEVGRVDGSRARWCAITGDAAPRKPITLAILADPRNPRAPAKWFAMDRAFAYLSATVGLEDKPFVLKAGRRLVLRYAVAVWSSPVDAERVERAYQAWRRLPARKP